MTSNALAMRLCRATRTAHTALEASPSIGRKHATLNDYRDHLRCLLSIHEPLEARLRKVPELHLMVPDLDEPWKAIFSAVISGPHAVKSEEWAGKRVLAGRRHSRKQINPLQAWDEIAGDGQTHRMMQECIGSRPCQSDGSQEDNVEAEAENDA